MRPQILKLPALLLLAGGIAFGIEYTFFDNPTPSRDFPEIASSDFPQPDLAPSNKTPESFWLSRAKSAFFDNEPEPSAADVQAFIDFLDAYYGSLLEQERRNADLTREDS